MVLSSISPVYISASLAFNVLWVPESVPKFPLSPGHQLITQPHTETNDHPHLSDNLELPASPVCECLDCGRTAEYRTKLLQDLKFPPKLLFVRAEQTERPM